MKAKCIDIPPRTNLTCNLNEPVRPKAGEFVEDTLDESKSETLRLIKAECNAARTSRSKSEYIYRRGEEMIVDNKVYKAYCVNILSFNIFVSRRRTVIILLNWMYLYWV